MGYHHPSHPVALDPARYDMLILGSEPISPFSAPGRAGRPRYTLPARPMRACRTCPIRRTRISAA